jgi:tRNA1Val (adenine37-N6)-methyltransferase
VTETNVQVKAGEILDQLGYQGLKILQNPTKFKFTLDAFLLAGFVNPKPTDNLIDLGTGGGVLPLLIAGPATLRLAVGLEIQPELAEMARRSVALNQLEERITIVEGDLRHLPETLTPNSFDWVISNPPFFPVAKGVISENQALAMAKFELACTMEEVVKAAARLVRGNGRVALIYPAERLRELLFQLERVYLSPGRLCFVHNQAGANAQLVMVEARPGSRQGLTVLPPIFIYERDGQYSERMNQIFHGKKF